METIPPFHPTPPTQQAMYLSAEGILWGHILPSFPGWLLPPPKPALLCVARPVQKGVFASGTIDSVKELQFSCRGARKPIFPVENDQHI